MGSSATFEAMGLSPGLMQGLMAFGFEAPTPIQGMAVPQLLRRGDVVAEAPSGSGKTLAFALPALAAVDTAQNAPQVLILAPTGVLAEQTASVLRRLGRFAAPSPVRIECVTKGTRLAGGPLLPHVVVATPAKLLDVCGLAGNIFGDQPGADRPRPVRQQQLPLGRVRLCVLDEADEMLDKDGFVEQLQPLIKALDLSCTMAFFSATLTPSTAERITVNRLVRDAPEDPAVPPCSWVSPASGGRLGGGESWDALSSLRPRIEHFHLDLHGPHGDQDWEARGAALSDVCGEFGAGAVVVFARSKEKVEFLAKGFGAYERGSRYTTDLERFRREPNLVLLATDACARGIDVEGVAVVVNFEVPRNDTQYTQRVGRAGRGGKTGTAITLVTTEDKTGFLALSNRLAYHVPPLPMSLSGLPGHGAAQPPVRPAGPTAAAATAAARPPTLAAAVPAAVPVAPTVLAAGEPPLGLEASSQLADEVRKLRDEVADLTRRLAAAETSVANAALSKAELVADLREELRADAARLLGEMRVEKEKHDVGEPRPALEHGAGDAPCATSQLASIAEKEPEIYFGFDDDDASPGGVGLAEVVPELAPQVMATASASTAAAPVKAPASPAAEPTATDEAWTSVSKAPKKTEKVGGGGGGAGAPRPRGGPSVAPLGGATARPPNKKWLGRARLEHREYVHAGTLRGVVTRTMANGSFLRFGDDRGAAPREGFLWTGRSVERPTVGAWLWVRVAHVRADGKIDIALA